DEDFNDLVFLVHSNPVTTIARDNLVSLPDPVDTDGDGVFDANDSFPTEPEKAFISYYPGAQTNGTLAFEDLWPSEGDYDMNDLKLSYRISEILDANHNIKSIQADFQILARGAGLHNGFGIAFGYVPPDTETAAEFILNDNSPTSLLRETNQDRLTYILLEDANVHSPALTGCALFNTQTSCGKGIGDTFSLQLTFGTPQTREAVGYPPYNPFIFRTDNRGLEVHLPDRSPTGLANLGMLSTGDDTSSYQSWRFYKTQDNLPWALDIPAPWRHPLERINITHTYFSFFNWAQSGGEQDWDWYVKNFQPQNLYPHD
ncbi:MAG: LruC domain-containing protein, partial [Pseudomonadota bacterium]